VPGVHAKSLKSTAVARAHLAYALMQRRAREAAMQRHLRERSRNAKLVIAVMAMLILVVVTALYNDWTPSTLRVTERNDSQSRQTGQHTVGQVRSYAWGDVCRELQFNNRRGVYVDGEFVLCETFLKPEATQGARVNSIRDAFTNR